MKRLSIFAVAYFFISFLASAQNIGFKAGVNFSNVIVSPEPANIFQNRTGFHAGLYYEIPINKKFSIQPEFLYSQQGFDVLSVANVTTHYLNMPILAKFKVNDESGLSVLVGPQISYLANTRIGVGNSSLFSLSYNGLFSRADIALVGGLEYELPKNLTIGGRYNLGVSNINKDFNVSSTQQFSDYFTMQNTNAQFYIAVKF